MGQGHGAPPGDEFDAIRARVDEVRREALARIEALKDPGSLDVRVPRRPIAEPQRPGPSSSTSVPPSATSTPPATGDRPPPPDLRGQDWRDRATGTSAAEPAPAPAPAPPRPELTRTPSGSGGSRLDTERPTPVPPPPVPPTPVPTPPAPPTRVRDRAEGTTEVPPVSPPSPAPVPIGRVIPLEDLPPPGAGWDADDALSDLDERGARRLRADADGPVRVGSLRAFIEGLATRRTVWATLWQLASVVVLVGAVTLLVWFPLAAGEGSQALVVPDDRMAPTITRGAVVVITPSPDLPYPLDTIVALDVGGVVVLERIVDERLEGDRRILVTRADGVAVGPNRDVPPELIVGAVRRITPVLGYPALWFDEPGGIVWRILLILVLVASAIGAASLVVRAELRRQDRLLVSAIASGDRTPLRR